MNDFTYSFRRLSWLAALLQIMTCAQAATFTNDTVIAVNNTNFEGQSIIVSNCTVTVNGFHVFSNVQLLNGAVLTHSFSTNGLLENPVDITDEPRTLSSSNLALLSRRNVLTNTVVVTSLDHRQLYQPGIDYGVKLENALTYLSLLPSSSITDGTTVAVSYTYIGNPLPSGLFLTITNNFEIGPGASVSASSKGYDAGLGPGAGASVATNYPYPLTAGGGGGHAGYGAPSSSKAAGGNAYGSLLLSSGELGSGGGAGSGRGGPGGGAIQITAGRLLRVDGLISANGGNGLNPHSGGGAGGSISLSAATLTGRGSIVANGGAGESPDGGGGGGGRVALYFSTNEFTGSISAEGGASAIYGGAGTVYTRQGKNPGFVRVIVENHGVPGTNTPISLSGDVSDLMIGGSAVVQPMSGQAAGTVSNLLIRSNSWLTSLPAQILGLTVLGNCTILSGGGISADGKGFSAGLGLGAGLSLNREGVITGGGGGYGGAGGASGFGAAGGNYFGTIQQPENFGGSGGTGAGLKPNSYGGSGGGAIRLSVTGTLTLLGRITANGNSGGGQGSGGGAGGSIRVTVGTLAGTGALVANGGAGETPLGGRWRWWEDRDFLYK